MNCPKCGKTLSFGEVCPCEHLDIYQRQIELEQEKELAEEETTIEYDNNIKEKNKKVKKKNEKAETTINHVAEFLKEMFYSFKNINQIDEYIETENTKYTVALYIINIILTIFMYHLLLMKSAISMIFTYYSVFSIKTSYVIFIASIFIALLTIFLTNGLLTFVTKKKIFYEISAGYIYEIPLIFLIIILTCISSILGVVLLPVLLVHKVNWIQDILKKYDIDRLKSTIFISVISLISSIIFFIITKLIA